MSDGAYCEWRCVQCGKRHHATSKTFTLDGRSLRLEDDRGNFVEIPLTDVRKNLEWLLT